MAWFNLSVWAFSKLAIFLICNQDKKMEKIALLWKKFKDNKVRCGLCNHRCIINDGDYGLCGVRKNKKGKLYSLVYGKAIAKNIDPIEKKPFFHFLPGTKSYSIATVGCNFSCLHCQNADISQFSKERTIEGSGFTLGRDLLPEEIVENALKNDCKSIAYTYTEPTVFTEYALDTMKLAKKKGLKNVWVSNGYMTKECLDLIAPYLDAINVDLKSFSEDFYREVCGARLAPVLENLKTIKKKRIWLEITTLLIPTKNDSEKEIKKIAKFISKELGRETPWHISRFFPAYKLVYLPPTDTAVIKKAVEIGKTEGLKYVYSGNIPGDSYEDTYCPKCGTKMIDRTGYFIERFDKKGKCAECGEDLNIIE